MRELLIFMCRMWLLTQFNGFWPTRSTEYTAVILNVESHAKENTNTPGDNLQGGNFGENQPHTASQQSLHFRHVLHIHFPLLEIYEALRRGNVPITFMMCLEGRLFLFWQDPKAVAISSTPGYRLVYISRPCLTCGVACNR